MLGSEDLDLPRSRLIVSLFRGRIVASSLSCTELQDSPTMLLASLLTTVVPSCRASSALSSGVCGHVDGIVWTLCSEERGTGRHNSDFVAPVIALVGASSTGHLPALEDYSVWNMYSPGMCSSREPGLLERCV